MIAEIKILKSEKARDCNNDKVVRDMLKSNELFGFGAELPNGNYKDYEGNTMITSEYAWFTKESTERRLEILLNNLLSIK